MIMEKYIFLIILSVYWIPIFLYLFIWSIKIRWYVKKYKIESLDTVHPITYKIGKLTNHQKLGEALMYAVAVCLGVFMFFLLPRNMIKDNLLPDD